MVITNILVIIGFLILLILIFLISLMISYKRYNELLKEAIQDKLFLATLSEFVIHTKAHTDKEIVTNDMVNAVKTCVNKGLYDVTPVDDNYTQDNAYYSFAEQMFKFVEDMDKE